MENVKTYTTKQLDVINAKSGYNMVLAGTGCGNNDILAERIVRAYENGDAELSDMLCLTFTNRAARGMYDEICKRLGTDSLDNIICKAVLTVNPLHSYVEMKMDFLQSIHEFVVF